MSGRTPVVAAPVETRTVRCERCDRWIEECAFCQDPGCRRVICYRCLREVLDPSVREPHAHGG